MESALWNISLHHPGWPVVIHASAEAPLSRADRTEATLTGSQPIPHGDGMSITSPVWGARYCRRPDCPRERARSGRSAELLVLFFRKSQPRHPTTAIRARHDPDGLPPRPWTPPHLPWSSRRPLFRAERSSTFRVFRSPSRAAERSIRRQFSAISTVTRVGPWGRATSKKTGQVVLQARAVPLRHPIWDHARRPSTPSTLIPLADRPLNSSSPWPTRSRWS